MSIRNLTLKLVPTVAFTEGTDVSLTETGQTIQNGLQLSNTDENEILSRYVVTLKSRLPVLDPKKGTFTKGKQSIVITIPTQLADGSVVFDTIRIERDNHPSSPFSHGHSLNGLAAQMLTSESFTKFWDAGSLA